MATDTSDRDRRDDPDDRRAAPRRSIEADARLELPDGVLHGSVVNISFGGAKFVTRKVTHEVSTGSRVTLWVTIDEGGAPGETSWRGSIVRRQRSGDDGPPRIAYAIEFDDSEPRPITESLFTDDD